MANAKNQATRAAVIGAAIVALLVCGCARNPKDDAQAYLNSLKMFNYPACYQMLSHQDQVDRTLEQFLAEIPLAPDVSRDWFRAIEQKMDYAPGEAAVQGDQAIVPIKVTMPDLALWERTLDAEQNAQEPVEKRAQDSLQQNHYPTLSYDDVLVMVKENGEWKVRAGFPAREAVAKLHKQAVELYHKGDYDRALSAYDELLAELSKTPATGNRGLAFRYERERRMIETAKAQLAEAQAYAAKLLLTNVDLKMTYSQVPGIFGQITNGGDRPVDEVRLTVTYYLGKGARRKVLFSEEHTPIDTPIEFSNFSHDVIPLAPNQTRDFGFKVAAPPEVQRTANVNLAVTMLVFSQLGVPAAVSSPATAPATAAPAAPPPPSMPKG
ncbi:MAG: hypothetical protein ABSD31_09650 [Candidatus Binataceae bacterium]|jgi:tetratricopeptide (TPR) repeat protein